MNLKHIFFLHFFSGLFRIVMLCISVLIVVCKSVFILIDRIIRQSQLVQSDIFFQTTFLDFFNLQKIFGKNHTFSIINPNYKRSLLLAFFSLFLFPFQVNAQEGFDSENTPLFYITEGTLVSGEEIVYVDKPDNTETKPKIAVSSKKSSKPKKQNAIQEAVEKKKIELEIPNGDFADSVYHTDTSSYSFSRNISLKSQVCAIVCTASLGKSLSENPFVYKNDFALQKSHSESVKAKHLSNSDFFLSEHFSYQFFGTSPPFLKA